MKVRTALGSRLRRIPLSSLVLAGLAAAIAMLVWLPNAVEQRRLQATIEERAVLLDWMRASVAEAQRLRGQHRTPAEARGSESLLALVDRSARGDGLSLRVSRSRTEGDRSVAVQFEGIEFDALVAWLGRLRSSHDIRALRASVTRGTAVGLVHGDLRLVENVD